MRQIRLSICHFSLNKLKKNNNNNNNSIQTSQIYVVYNISRSEYNEDKANYTESIEQLTRKRFIKPL